MRFVIVEVDYYIIEFVVFYITAYVTYYIHVIFVIISNVLNYCMVEALLYCSVCWRVEWITLCAHFDVGTSTISSYGVWWSSEGWKVPTTDNWRSFTQSCTDSER